MLKPFKSTVYVQYKCEACGQISENMRISVLNVHKPSFVCSCGHINYLQKLKLQAKCVYDKVNPNIIIKKVSSILSDIGYSSQEIKTMLSLVDKDSITSSKSLLKDMLDEFHKDC